jgi:hypothetical protein
MTTSLRWSEVDPTGRLRPIQQPCWNCHEIIEGDPKKITAERIFSALAKHARPPAENASSD